VRHVDDVESAVRDREEGCWPLVLRNGNAKRCSNPDPPPNQSAHLERIFFCATLK
jgi:hypothetical protein